VDELPNTQSAAPVRVDVRERVVQAGGERRSEHGGRCKYFMDAASANL
jgi:hypothetical protein